MAYLFALPLVYVTRVRNLVWSDGLHFWGAILQASPDKARAWNNYGVELSLVHGRYADAIPYFKKAIMMDKYYSDPCNSIAVAYAHSGDIDSAIDALMMAVRINPYSPEVYNNLASFLMQKKDFARAQIALSQALQLRPYYGKAHFNRGRIHLEEKDFEKAWESFKQACMYGDFDNELGFFYYGRLSLMTKRYDEAIIGYQKLLQVSPHHIEGQLGLAATHVTLKNFDQAIALYNNVLNKNPHYAPAWQGLGECHFSLGSMDCAVTCFLNAKKYKETIADTSTLPHLFLRLATCYERLNNPRNAHAILGELLAFNNPPELIQQVVTMQQQLVARYNLT